MFFVIVHGAATRELRLEVRDVVYDLLVSQVGVKAHFMMIESTLNLLESRFSSFCVTTPKYVQRHCVYS